MFAPFRTSGPLAERSVANTQTFTATPAEAAENTVSTDDEPNQGARQYSVDVGEAQAVDIALVPCENVSVSDAGAVTFEDDENLDTDADLEGDDEADELGETLAEIEVINGVAGDYGDWAQNVAATNGTVTFTVDSTEADCVTPVIFTDADDQEDLDLDAENAPTDDFGLGGEKTFLPEEAAAGTGNEDLSIDRVNEDEDYLIASDLADATDDAVYEYDSNDVFYVVAGAPVVPHLLDPVA